ncbi:MAG: hypothetical protein FWG77_10690 [Treponema sp.]|nr:hypothetical protein [Treponema sp.]
MKKTLSLIFILLFLAPALFAENAMVLPRLTGGIYAAPLYSFARGFYDDNRGYHSYHVGSVKIYNLGLAFGFGITEWLTARVEWMPGWNFWSDTSIVTGNPESDINSTMDLSVAAKIQLAGNTAPLQSYWMRFAFEPRVTIPTSDYSMIERGRFALGLGFYFDFVLSNYFYLNLHNKSMLYPFSDDPIDNSLKYQLEFEIEPVITLPISWGIDLSLGVPVNFIYSTNLMFPETHLLPAPNTLPQYNLTVNPAISIHFKTLTLPLELKVQYSMPIIARNSLLWHSTGLYIGTFFSLPGGAQ